GTRYWSGQWTRSWAGSWASISQRGLAAWLSSARGSTRSCLWRRRYAAATIVGTTAVSAIASATVGFWSALAAPCAEIAVRSTSMGSVSYPSAVRPLRVVSLSLRAAAIYWGAASSGAL